MTDQEIIEVVTAHKEGKQIQGKHPDLSNVWVDLVHEPIVWDFMCKVYRVKPEPRLDHLWLLNTGDGFWKEQPWGLGRHFVLDRSDPTHLKFVESHEPVQPRKPREWWILPDRSVHELPRIEIVRELPAAHYVHVVEVLE